MTPAFASWQEFFAMGGYAFYVWLAVACTLAALAGLILHTFIQHRALLKAIRQRQLRERRLRAVKQQQVAGGVQ
ncbi:heme exporter protein CcmD [Erwinia oleae]|uniref:heme exporter protein CcmD n=1 Tax=Erwinia oleae TaxID=796334 RepID=UPI00055400A6|nr:heme exporter protein CcmD [Erwinia oleae]